METKKIKIVVVINGNDDSVVATMPANEVDALLALYYKAKESVLQGIEEEDQYLTFDPWLKEQNADLYEKAMNEFISGFNFSLNEPREEDGWELLEKCYVLKRDMYGYCLADEGNEIYIDYFE